MVEIKPLEGIIYNQERVNIKDVVAPPYDVIGSDYQEKLYEKSPYNIVRLILAKGENRYEDAKKDFEEWQKEGVLQKTKKPSIFYLVQKYTTEQGRTIERKGFIAGNKIENFENGKVLPHEFTMGGPKEDRLKLTTACKVNFSQIFMVYSDPKKIIEKELCEKITSKKPFIDVIDDGGVQNLVWIIDDEADIALIKSVMEDKTLLIADGHHRYETAMNYSKINTSPEAQYVMSYFTNLNDENLIVFPTHRIIKRHFEHFSFIEKIKKYFEIEEFNFDSYTKAKVKAEFLAKIEEENAKQISFGLYMKNVNKFFLLKLKPKMLDLIDAPEVLKKLDLTVLHELLITKEFGYSKEAQMAQDGIKYIKQESEAFDLIDSGKAEASFIMAYPKMSDIRDISGAGYKMPQKSTYFYPKLLSGVVINPL